MRVLRRRSPAIGVWRHVFFEATETAAEALHAECGHTVTRSDHHPCRDLAMPALDRIDFVPLVAQFPDKSPQTRWPCVSWNPPGPHRRMKGERARGCDSGSTGFLQAGAARGVAGAITRWCRKIRSLVLCEPASLFRPDRRPPPNDPNYDVPRPPRPRGVVPAREELTLQVSAAALADRTAGHDGSATGRRSAGFQPVPAEVQAQALSRVGSQDSGSIRFEQGVGRVSRCSRAAPGFFRARPDRPTQPFPTQVPSAAPVASTRNYCPLQTRR